MTQRELHCPNLQVHKVATLVALSQPVKPSHPPIADIIRVSSSQQTGKGNAIRQLCKERSLSITCHTSLWDASGQRGSCFDASRHMLFFVLPSTLHTALGHRSTEDNRRQQWGCWRGGGGQGGAGGDGVMLRHPCIVAGFISTSHAYKRLHLARCRRLAMAVLCA